MVAFRILGPVEVVHEGQVAPVGGPRHRRLLAALLLHAGQVVSAARLIDALWGDEPPRSAPSMLQVRVSELRAALRVAGASLLTRDGGYLLRAGPDELDAWRFERLAAAGAAALADGDPERARADLSAGLALWRGPALAGFAEEAFARAEAARLEELRLQVVENRIAAELELGGHGELIAELEKLVAEYPLRERFWTQHMLALYRAGRRGDALRAYQTARRHITEQLGLDPGDGLQRLHHAILTADPALTAAGGTRHGGGEVRIGAVNPPVVPAQLPGDVPAFTGRVWQLRWLDQVLTGDRDGREPALAVAVVSGTAGVGKTALAIRWAHQNRGRFPDGQLYVNLRGYDPQQPMSAADALARFLAALGVSNAEIPADADERASRYRTEMVGRRMLVLLDNASSVEQVRPLLPGTASSAVVVTSRDSMAGLVAREGAYRLSLDLLPRHDARALLRRLIGDRADAEPEAVATLAEYCARLPLALRVAAELAIGRPATSLSTLVDELADLRQRLEQLDAGGDPRAAVPTVFSWSVRHLPPDAARTFRLLGLHPGAEVDAYAAAALTGVGLAAAERALHALARAHLLHEAGPDRYGMHDLLRAYAADLAGTGETETARRTALGRLFDYYLAAAAAAMDQLYPSEKHRRPRVFPADTAIPDLTDPGRARAWLDIERPCLVAVAGHAASHGWPTHAIRLSSTLYRYLDGGHYTDALALHGCAHRAAEQIGDQAGDAEALLGLGAADGEQSRYEQAAGHLRQALVLFRQVGDRIGAARALNGLGLAEQKLGRYRNAARQLRRALTLFRQADDLAGEAVVVNNLGLVEQSMGRYRRAAALHERALRLYRQLGNPAGEASALRNLGEARQRLGQHQAALDHLTTALALCQRYGHRPGEAWARASLAGTLTRLGHHRQAAEHYRQALTRFHELGGRDGQVRVLNGLGEVARAAGQPGQALTHHSAALALAIEIKAPYEQARAHAGLGQAHRALGNPEQARHHYELALAGYDSVQSSQARSVRPHLADLDTSVDTAGLGP
jgi:DNA-binding SARP family transcriptional activator/tetratricopeptide (TPR) repeat protein